MGDAGEIVEGAAVGQGKYTVVFKASQPCEGVLLNEASMYPPLHTTLKVKSMSSINQKISSENAAPEPEVILQDGQKITLKNTLKFDSYIKDSDFDSYVLVKKEPEPQKEKQLKWWYFALPFGICGLTATLCAFCCLACRKRKIIENTELDILEKQIQEAEKKGIEIPDDLKKVKSDSIKRQRSQIVK